MSATLTPQLLQVRLSSLPVGQMSVMQAATCSELTLGEEGIMAGNLARERYREKSKASAILAHDLEGRLVGWCLLLERGVANFFVSESARRRRVGSALLRESIRLSEEEIKVEAHDTASSDFFSRFSREVQIWGWYRPSDGNE